MMVSGVLNRVFPSQVGCRTEQEEDSLFSPPQG